MQGSSVIKILSVVAHQAVVQHTRPVLTVYCRVSYKGFLLGEVGERL